MKLINLNKLTAQSNIITVLQTGAHITFPTNKNATLLVAYRKDRNLCLRVDWWIGKDVMMQEFTLDRFGLEKAFIFIGRL